MAQEVVLVLSPEPTSLVDAYAVVKVHEETPFETLRNRYYDGMLYFLSVLHVSGQFRDWTIT
jgi:MinD-like ATPase involved in chromosome partitioning or flagellar assembly